METTLIVCEKPSAAQHIAEALSNRKGCNRLSKNGVPYFEINQTEGKIIVCCALGHLYGVAAKERQRGYPIWDICWKPNYQIRRQQAKQRSWIEALSSLAEKATQFVNACDYDIEGSLIGYMILKYACGGADTKARRMRFSALTEKDIIASYNSLLPTLDYPLADAGRCRHEVDWLYGINLSRALTQSTSKYHGSYSILSTGRVQGPTLKFIVDREKEILTFTPLPYWVIQTYLDIDGTTVEANYQESKIDKKYEADKIVDECKGKEVIVKEISSTRIHMKPPPPFDLTTLQTEAYRHLHMTPNQTLQTAEHLYLDAAISYPRTSSQKLPETIGYKEIIKNMAQLPDYTKAAQIILQYKALKPNEGKKTDPAHPAIYPTGIQPKRELSSRSLRLYDLVVKRFFSTFGEYALKEALTALLDKDPYKFFIKGSHMIKNGWTTIYQPYVKLEEVPLPPITKDQKIPIKEIRSQQKFTTPPQRFNPSSLLRLMETEGIGTKATRAGIIETLYKRKYIMSQRIEATPLSFTIIELMTKYCPLITDVDFTKTLELKMQMIEEEKTDRESIIQEAVEHLNPAITRIKSFESYIGSTLSKVIKEMQQDSSKLDRPCPRCGSTLLIIKNSKTGKRFIGCSSYNEKNCRFSLPLPPNGRLTILKKNCEKCGFQLIQIKQPYRHSFISCPQCYVEKIQKSTQPPI